jgi:hypothetical protein
MNAATHTLPPIQMPSSSMRQRQQHRPTPPLNCHDHHVLSSLHHCRNLVRPPVHPVAGSWTCSITTTAPTGREGRVPPESCRSPPHRCVFTIATAVAVFVFPTGCHRHRHCQRIKEGAVLVLRGRGPDVPRGRGPDGDKAEAESKVEAKARLSVSQVDSEWAASSPRSCCRWGRLPSQTPRATGPGHRRRHGRGAHCGPPPSNSPTVIGLASE